MNNRPDYARELRNTIVDSREVCARLGLLGGKGSWVRQSNGVIVRCPWHEEKTPSCSVRRGPDGTIQVRCHGCGVGGDVLSLVAQVNGLSTRSDFVSVLLATAELGGRSDIAEALNGNGNAQQWHALPPPSAPRDPERVHMAKEDCNRFWGILAPVSADAEVSTWLASRGLDAETVEGNDWARALPATAECPRWARYQGADWTQTGHRLILPMFDASGEMRGVRAGRVVDGDTPKRLPPGGFRASGLVLANDLAIAMLRGTYSDRNVVIVEGEPDALAWMAHRPKTPTAVMGIVSGGWTGHIAHRVTTGATITLLTHADRAGDRYAQEIVDSIGKRCFFHRRAA